MSEKMTPKIKEQISDHLKKLLTPHPSIHTLIKNESKDDWCDGGVDIIVFYNDWNASETYVSRYYFGTRTEYMLEDEFHKNSVLKETEILTTEEAKDLWEEETKDNGFEKVAFKNGVPSHALVNHPWKPGFSVKQTSFVRIKDKQ